MDTSLSVREILIAANVPEDKIAQYQTDRNIEVIHGQRQLLCRYRHRQNEVLREKRRQLACLDYVIAHMEGVYGNQVW